MRFRRQLPAWSPLTLGAVLAGVQAAWLDGGQAARRRLEGRLREAYSPQDLYLTDSGTSALTLALRAANSTTGAPVALPAYSCYDVATAALGAAVPFLFYDVSPETLSPDLSSLRRAFELGARSVVVAHLYGVPADLAGVQALADEFGAVVIEDAAQGSGCVWRGRPAGAHGSLGILSFGRGKGVTGGRGGALLVNEPRLSGAVAAAWEAGAGPRTPRGTARDVGLLFAQWLFGRPWLYWIPASIPALGLGETRFRPPGPVGGLSSFAAGVLNRTIPLASAEAEHRRDAVLRFDGQGVTFTLIRPPSDWLAGYLRMPVVLSRTARSAGGVYPVRLGVQRGYPSTLVELEGFGAAAGNARDEFPGARSLVDRLVTLPTHRMVRNAGIPRF